MLSYGTSDLLHLYGLDFFIAREGKQSIVNFIMRLVQFGVKVCVQWGRSPMYFFERQQQQLCFCVKMYTWVGRPLWSISRGFLQIYKLKMHFNHKRQYSMYVSICSLVCTQLLHLLGQASRQAVMLFLNSTDKKNCWFFFGQRHQKCVTEKQKIVQSVQIVA